MNDTSNIGNKQATTKTNPKAVALISVLYNSVVVIFKAFQAAVLTPENIHSIATLAPGDFTTGTNKTQTALSKSETTNVLIRPYDFTVTTDTKFAGNADKAPTTAVRYISI